MADVKIALETVMDDFFETIKEQAKKRRPQPDEQIALLRAAKIELDTKHNFVVGDVVVWKKGLRNLKASGPMLIVEILPAPAFYPNFSAASVVFMDTYEAFALWQDQDGDIVRTPLNLSRVQPFKQEQKH